MPRRGQGGGAGGVHPQRTDLNQPPQAGRGVARPGNSATQQTSPDDPQQTPEGASGGASPERQGAPQGERPQQGPAPGSLGPVDAPTERPSEHPLEGADRIDQLVPPQQPSEKDQFLKALYAKNPNNEDLRRLIESRRDFSPNGSRISRR